RVNQQVFCSGRSCGGGRRNQMSTVANKPPEARVAHVSGPRPTFTHLAHQLADVAVRQRAALAAASAAGLLEAWGRQSRATGLERRKPLPGDELVPQPKWQATRATTICAPREEVWPWLVQMG